MAADEDDRASESLVGISSTFRLVSAEAPSVFAARAMPRKRRLSRFASAAAFVALSASSSACSSFDWSSSRSALRRSVSARSVSVSDLRFASRFSKPRLYLVKFRDMASRSADNEATVSSASRRNRSVVLSKLDTFASYFSRVASSAAASSSRRRAFRAWCDSCAALLSVSERETAEAPDAAARSATTHSATRAAARADRALR